MPRPSQGTRAVFRPEALRRTAPVAECGRGHPSEALSVRRDSLFGEEVLWSGRPKVVTTPIVYRAAAAVCAVAAAVSTAFAVVVSTALHAPPSGLLAFAAWMSTLAIVLDFGPR